MPKSEDDYSALRQQIIKHRNVTLFDKDFNDKTTDYRVGYITALNMCVIFIMNIDIEKDSRPGTANNKKTTREMIKEAWRGAPLEQRLLAVLAFLLAAPILLLVLGAIWYVVLMAIVY